MNVEPDLDSSAYQCATIQNRWTTELEKLRLQKFPQGFPKLIHVLEAVDDNVDGEWEQRLQQASQDHIEECIALVPYYLGNFHWIGILMEFTENRQIQRAEFIDPVVDSKFVPNKIQKEFDKFYSAVILSSKGLQKHEDPKQSAQLTIRHLIKSIEESLLTAALHQNTNDSHNQISDEKQTRTYLLEDNQFNWQKPMSTIETLSKLQGNKTLSSNVRAGVAEVGSCGGVYTLPITEDFRFFPVIKSIFLYVLRFFCETLLQIPLNIPPILGPSRDHCVRATLINEDRRHFLTRHLRTEQQIEGDENSGTNTPSEIEENYFDSLSTQLIATKELHNTTINDSVPATDSRDQSEQYESFKKQLRDDLYKHEISDEKELEEEIVRKEQEIHALVQQGRHNVAKKRRESLSKLEDLQQLVNKVRAFERQQTIDNLEELKAKLAIGFRERDVRGEKELKEDIIKKKQEIETLEKRGKYKAVLKRQESLSTLEQLLEWIDKIKALEPNLSSDNLENLEAALISGLLEHDISDEKELEEEIMNRKQAIETLKNKGKYETAEKRRNSLSTLEELQVLTNKIRALQTPNSSKSNEISDGVGVTDRPNSDGIISGRQEEDTITKERVKNLYNDFFLMPPCSEKSLISLMFFIALKSIDEAVVSDKNIVIPDEIDAEIANEIQCLKERLKIEELESTQVKNFMGTVSVNIKDQHWKSAFSTLEKILKLIRPLNIPELFRLFEKVDDIAHLIKGEDIILLLGRTGAGKSTTIHFLGGSELKEIKVTGLNHIHPVEIRNPNLKKIITTPFARSETQCITPVRVYFKDVGGYSNESIVLCDTPGFQDTSGPEVDIANGISIVKAIKESKSVKPVVLISYKSIGDRLGGVKDLARTLVELIPEIRNHIKTFSYIFTKFPPNERNIICGLLTNAEETLNETEKSDIAFSNLFQDMINKTRHGARALDPIKDDAFEILRELVESDAITYPDEVFQFFITEKSKAILQEQVRRHQLSIISATKRYDYSVAKYKLDQLKRLNDIPDQEYIKQIYNDCIQYIVKHLSEEYEESISRLNRYLMNQIILSNEDIHHYQTCIDHAKLTNELRESHLGQEVIHSNAFIQNINQQIEAMITELREKEINDQLVKINLDKIKLVSNSFSDIDQKKYKSICQVLVEKFELVINSFKISVLSNKFDESANDIRKLHEALTILQDHVDCEYMRTKYIQMKEYFLDYLNDSIEKLNHLFDQEKLHKNDIDNLNSCIYIVENAKNTFALQTYFSKEAIDNIHEHLLSKILSYYEKIVKKINTELKNENAFRRLEQLFTELDSLRTISIIELKTTQSYYNLLEKIVEYLRNLKRDVEQLLTVLFQQEGNVNYDKLIKYLLSLKSAQWIEKYRVGEYSNVMSDVEEQFNGHIKEMKRSIMEINLDLDNYTKIDSVYKVVLEINQMKKFKKIFPDVNQHLVDVNSWFEGVINNVCVIIKDSFIIEKFKEQEHKSLDFNKAEKACRYLDVCIAIGSLSKNDCLSVLNSLENYIRYYSQIVQNEMINSFDKIQQFQDMNIEDMYGNIRILSTRLQEISEIKTKYSRSFSSFVNQNLFQQWQRELSNYLTELSDEMERLCVTRQIVSLKNKLLVIKTLSRLDMFLEGEKYIDIYVKYQTIFLIKIKDTSENVVDAIQKHDYQQIAFEMLALKLSGDVGEHFFEQDKQLLNRHLDHLIEETKIQAIMLENNPKIDRIKLIVENLKRIEKAKQFVSEYINTSYELSESVIQVKLMIEQRLKHSLNEIKALIYIHNFYEAEQKIELINSVRTLLGNCCTKQVSDEIELIKEYRSKIVLDEIVTKYTDMDMDGYILNPPMDIFEKFGQVKNINPIYPQALNKLRENIINKFRRELELAKSVIPPNLSNIHLRKFESAVKHLPEAIRNALEVELKHCKEDIHF